MKLIVVFSWFNVRLVYVSKMHTMQERGASNNRGRKNAVSIREGCSKACYEMTGKNS